jgi:hypothetical protein
VIVGATALAVAGLTLVTAIVGLWQTIVNKRRIADVHVLVNSQRDEALARIAQLEIIIVGAGVDLPDKTEG